MEFITPDEKATLEQQLSDLIEFRPVISQRIGEARAMGDLKENADYHAARDDQGHNERKIRDIEAKLKRAKVIDENDESIPDDMVFLGSVVKLRDLDDDSEDLYKLVGESSGEFNFDADEIEVTTTSPMGESLLKARVGETVKVNLPHGDKRFEIIEIQK